MSKIVQIPFNDYYREVTNKTQIYLHHTAGTGKGDDVYRWWGSDKPRVATCVVIDRDGTIKQGFGSQYWAYHLGLPNSVFKGQGLPYINLDKISIGIELVNWGQLTKKGQKFYSYTGKEVEDVCEVSYKGFKYFENYTEAQIESVKYLLELWHNKYDIDIKYNEDIFKLNTRALKGQNGLYTHNSVRVDKVDVYPHPNLIEMLKTL